MSRKKVSPDLKAFEAIIQACQVLGWEIAFPNTGEVIRGFVIGKPEYVNKVLGAKKKTKARRAKR